VPHRWREAARGNRSAYVGTAAIEDIDDAQGIMLIGTNPRVEAPVLNARIRKAWTRGANVGLIGAAADLTYDVAIGHGRAALEKWPRATSAPCATCRRW
jgi:NADH-quinone oxidoreductase subunit G